MWVWVNSGSWWWTGRPGVLWVMGSQRVGHDWATELNWTVKLLNLCLDFICKFNYKLGITFVPAMQSSTQDHNKHSISGRDFTIIINNQQLFSVLNSSSWLHCLLDQRFPTFWPQGLVSWKTIFPRMGAEGGEQQVSEQSKASWTLLCSLLAIHLLLWGLVPVPRPGGCGPLF